MSFAGGERQGASAGVFPSSNSQKFMNGGTGELGDDCRHTQIDVCGPELNVYEDGQKGGEGGGSGFSKLNPESVSSEVRLTVQPCAQHHLLRLNTL